MTSTPEKLVPGSKALMLIKVRNTGNEKAESVSLRVFKDAAQPFEFSEKSGFVGKLDPGESGDAAVRFTIDRDAVAKKYLLDVELRGIDTKENVLIFRRTIPLTVDPEEGGLPLKGMGLLAGLMAFSALAAYYFMNNKEKRG